MRIIKATETEARVGICGLRLGAPRRVAALSVPTPADTELASLRQDLSFLSRQLEAKDAEIAELRQAVAQSRADGEVAGRVEGLGLAEAREAEKLEALRNGIDHALDQLLPQIRDLNALAPLIAREGLGRILGDAALYPDLIAHIVRRQLTAIGDQVLLAVEVSAGDFSTPEALTALATSVGRPEVAVTINDSLSSGDCRLRLKLGAIDVGVRQQWDALSSVLSDLADENGPP